MTALDWTADLDHAVRQAGAQRRFVLADFSKPHCAGCEALDTISFPDESVREFVEEHLIPCRVTLGGSETATHFRRYQVIWTPTLVFIDRRGSAHYQAPGYLPPRDLLPLLRIGTARCQLAWAKHAEAIALLESAAAEPGPLAAEALYHLGMAYYLRSRARKDLMRAWGRLREEYPGTVWAARIPPGQEAEEPG